MRWFPRFLSTPFPSDPAAAPQTTAQAAMPASPPRPPPRPDPERTFVMAQFNACRAKNPTMSWAAFIEGLEFRHRVATEEVARRQAKLSQLQIQGRSTS